jgi:hypothetical protein
MMEAKIINCLQSIRHRKPMFIVYNIILIFQTYLNFSETMTVGQEK